MTYFISTNCVHYFQAHTHQEVLNSFSPLFACVEQCSIPILKQRMPTTQLTSPLDVWVQSWRVPTKPGSHWEGRWGGSKVGREPEEWSWRDRTSPPTLSQYNWGLARNGYPAGPSWDRRGETWQTAATTVPHAGRLGVARLSGWADYPSGDTTWPAMHYRIHA